MAFERLFAAWVVATEPRDDQGDDDGLPLGDAFEPLSDCALRRDLGVLKRLSFLTPKRRSFFFAVRFLLLLQKSEPYSLSLSLSRRVERDARKKSAEKVSSSTLCNTLGRGRAGVARARCRTLSRTRTRSSCSATTATPSSTRSVEPRVAASQTVSFSNEVSFPPVPNWPRWRVVFHKTRKPRDLREYACALSIVQSADTHQSPKFNGIPNSGARPPSVRAVAPSPASPASVRFFFFSYTAL